MPSKSETLTLLSRVNVNPGPRSVIERKNQLGKKEKGRKKRLDGCKCDTCGNVGVTAGAESLYHRTLSPELRTAFFFSLRD